MSIICNDTQLVLLSAASQRDDHCLVPPAGPKRGQAQRAVAKLVEAGLVKEIRAKAGGPIWRRDGETGQTYALKLTAAGAKAIAVDETGPSEAEAERRPDHPIISIDPKAKPGSDPAAAIDRPDSGVAPTPISPRGGTKIAQVIELLQRGDGATLAELIAATGWLPHTMRAALTGLRKRGYAVGIDRADKARGSVYRIEPTEMGGDSAAPHVAAAPTSETPRDRPERAVSQRIPSGGVMRARKSERRAARHRSRQRYRRQNARRSTPRSRAFPASTRISFAENLLPAQQRGDLADVRLRGLVHDDQIESPDLAGQLLRDTPCGHDPARNCAIALRHLDPRPRLGPPRRLSGLPREWDMAEAAKKNEIATGTEEVNAGHLRAFIERIERLEEEKKALSDDIKDVFGEAKANGFDVKVMRKIISLRKQDRDKRMEEETILDLYLAALGMN